MIGLAASVVVGLVLSAAWGLFLDDRVFSPAEIEVIVMVPVLGAVPKERDKKKKGKDKGAAPGKGLGVSRA
jgi:capsular polysaccharide biosynthesis protein